MLDEPPGRVRALRRHRRGRRPDLRARVPRRGVGGHGDRGDGRDRAVPDRDLRQHAARPPRSRAFAVVCAILSGGYNDNYGTSDYFVRLAVDDRGRRCSRSRRRGRCGGWPPIRSASACCKGAAAIADTASIDPRGRRPRRRAAGARLRRHLRHRRACAATTSSGSASAPRARTPGGRGAPARPRPRHARADRACRAGAARARRRGLPARQRHAARTTTPSCARSTSARTSTSRCAAAAATSARWRCWPSTRSYGPVDLELAELIAGRVGLALDNAGLFAELEALQAPHHRARHPRRGGHDPGRRRPAWSTPTTRPPRARLRHRRSCWRHSPRTSSTPTSPSTRTAAAAARGPARPPGARRARRRSRCWSARSTAARARSAGAWSRRPAGPTGEPRLAVNVIEDVTEVKRAEHAPALPRRGERGAGLRASTTSRRWPRSPSSPCRGSRTGARVTLPRRRLAAQPSPSPTSTRPSVRVRRRLPASASRPPVDAPTGAAQVLRDGSSQLINAIDRRAARRAIADPEQREALRGARDALR